MLSNGLLHVNECTFACVWLGVVSLSWALRSYDVVNDFCCDTMRMYVCIKYVVAELPFPCYGCGPIGGLDRPRRIRRVVCVSCFSESIQYGHASTAH